METTAKSNKVVMKSFFINLDLIDVNKVTLIFILSTLHPHQEHHHWNHPIERHQDIGSIGISSAVEMPAVKGIQNIRSIGISALVNMFAIPRVENIRCIGISSTIDMLTVPGIDYVGIVLIPSVVQMLSVPGVQNI